MQFVRNFAKRTRVTGTPFLNRSLRIMIIACQICQFQQCRPWGELKACPPKPPPVFQNCFFSLLPPSLDLSPSSPPLFSPAAPPNPLVADPTTDKWGKDSFAPLIHWEIAERHVLLLKVQSHYGKDQPTYLHLFVTHQVFIFRQIKKYKKFIIFISNSVGEF